MRLALSKLTYRFCSTTMKPVNLKFDPDNKSAYVTLTNPNKRNTLSLQTIGLLKKSISQVESSITDRKTRIVILQSEGTVFSSGHDLRELNKLSNPKEVFDNFAELMLKIHNLSIPIVCGVNGIAAAAGFQLAMGCDILIATEKSTFSCPGVKWGVFCSTPGVELVRSINSIKKANEMLFFGEQITAQEAYHYGIVNKIVAEDRYKETIDSYISKISALSAQVIMNGKKVLKTQREENIVKAYEIAGQAMAKNIKQTEDCKEGLKAFAQKRHPHFKN